MMFTATVWLRLFVALALVSGAVTTYDVFTSDAYLDALAEIMPDVAASMEYHRAAPRDASGAMLLRTDNIGAVEAVAISDYSAAAVLRFGEGRTWETQSGRLASQFKRDGSFGTAKLAFLSTPLGSSLLEIYMGAAGKAAVYLDKAESSPFVARNLDNGEAPSALLVDASGHMVAVVSRDAKVYCWDAVRGQPLQQWDAQLKGPGLPAVVGLTKHAALSADGSTLAIVSEFGPIGVWNPANTLIKQRINAPTANIQDLALTPDGKTLISILDDGHVWETEVANPANSRDIVQFPVVTAGSATYKLALSANGNHLAIAQSLFSAPLVVAGKPVLAISAPQPTSLRLVRLNRSSGARRETLIAPPAGEQSVGRLEDLAVSNAAGNVALGFQSSRMLLVD